MKEMKELINEKVIIYLIYIIFRKSKLKQINKVLIMFYKLKNLKRFLLFEIKIQN